MRSSDSYRNDEVISCAPFAIARVLHCVRNDPSSNNINQPKPNVKKITVSKLPVQCLVKK